MSEFEVSRRHVLVSAATTPLLTGRSADVPADGPGASESAPSATALYGYGGSVVRRSGAGGVPEAFGTQGYGEYGYGGSR